MREVRGWLWRLGGLFQKERREQEFDEELESHLQMHIDDNLRAGLSPREARRQALIKLGGIEQTKELYRDRRGIPFLERLFQDACFGIRMVRKSPVFTLVVVATLGLGIGANTAIFSIVNAVLLRPLPYRDPGQLFLIREVIPAVSPNPLSVPAPDILEFQEHTHSFSRVAGFDPLLVNFSGGGEPERVRAVRVSSNLFDMLGVPPLRGRAFRPQEDQGENNVVVLSYPLWERRFGGDTSIIGRKVFLDSQPFLVVGVMPRDFSFPLKGFSSGPADLWVPLALTPQEKAAHGDNFNYGVLARIKPGVSLVEARSDVDLVSQGIFQSYPASVRDSFTLHAVLLPLRERVVFRVRKLLLLLLGAVGFVLLIACANVANMLLSRAMDRKVEISVRAALGAGRGRLLQMLLTECLLLSLLGGMLGLLLGYWSTRFMASLLPSNIPRLEAIGVDVNVLVFTAAIAVLTGIIFGLAPALSISRKDLMSSIRQGGRENGKGGYQKIVSATLVISQVALALVLLCGATLLLRSFFNARGVDAGFNRDHLLTFSVNLPEDNYSKALDVTGFYRRLRVQMERLPGVRLVGYASSLPLEAGWTRIMTAQDHPELSKGTLTPIAHSVVGGTYFRALGIPLRQGRLLNDVDRLQQRKVVIVSQNTARHYWPGENPVGRKLKWGPPRSQSPWLTVVGVVGDVKQGALDQSTGYHTYVPVSQEIEPVRLMYFVAKTQLPPMAVFSSIKEIVAGLDPQVPVAQVRTMDQVVSQSLAPRRFNTVLITAFALVALLLAGIGLYGVISYSVSRRRHEIGIRIALGAEPGRVRGLIVRQAAKLTAIGVFLGLGASLLVSRALSKLLFEIAPYDPSTMLAAGMVLAAISILASYIPARRACRVNPVRALRCE